MLNKFSFNNGSKNISLGIVLSIAMILTLPLCGFLFDCGCAWLWAEMDENCNIHDLEKIHKCPWCQSLVAALLSLGLSTLAAAWAIYRYNFDVTNHTLSVQAITLYSVLGLSVFFVIAFFTAWASALFQNYPGFLL